MSDLPVFFHKFLSFSCYFSQVARRSADNVKKDVLMFRTELEKRNNKSQSRLFTLRKQTFSSQHVTFHLNTSKQHTVLSTIKIKRRKKEQNILQAVLMQIQQNSGHCFRIIGAYLTLGKLLGSKQIREMNQLKTYSSYIIV